MKLLSIPRASNGTQIKGFSDDMKFLTRNPAKGLRLQRCMNKKCQSFMYSIQPKCGFCLHKNYEAPSNP